MFIAEWAYNLVLVQRLALLSVHFHSSKLITNFRMWDAILEKFNHIIDFFFITFNVHNFSMSA